MNIPNPNHFLFADNTTRIVASAAALLFLGNILAKAA